MARTYAGILGPLALLTSLAHGVIQAKDTEAVLFAAWCSLLAFAALGYVVGWIAGRTVEESVSASIRAQLGTDQSGEDSEAIASTA